MRAIETGRLADDDPTVVEESSFCLGCRACEPVCPAGVQYGALLEEWRDHTVDAPPAAVAAAGDAVGGERAPARAGDGPRASPRARLRRGRARA